eukprot:Platyproteum_vivax@DN16393_c0_g1_i1.p1
MHLYTLPPVAAVSELNSDFSMTAAMSTSLRLRDHEQGMQGMTWEKMHSTSWKPITRRYSREAGGSNPLKELHYQTSNEVFAKRSQEPVEKNFTLAAVCGYGGHIRKKDAHSISGMGHKPTMATCHAMRQPPQ